MQSAKYVFLSQNEETVLSVTVHAVQADRRKYRHSSIQHMKLYFILVIPVSSLT